VISIGGYRYGRRELQRTVNPNNAGIVIPGANLGDMLGRKTGVPLLGDVIDFFNPLSDVQDAINIIDWSPEGRTSMVREDATGRIFRVTLGGRRCMIRIDDGSGGDSVRRVGFITTRFVRAATPHAAADAAIRRVQGELERILLNTRDEACAVEAEEVREESSGLEGREYGGGGFTWFPDDEQQGD
jgi:hypothetical protein